MIPRTSPSTPVLGGDENAAMTTTTSATLTMMVAMNWKAVAASSEGHDWFGTKMKRGWQSVATGAQ